ncbi:hypothetical protein LCGC14_1127260 [marine sediment metagenome]|uniref:Uncharacterized protein n=1 Tax=marine sediment metagenome TaxID=412755 RepID=A0A0F9MQ21_9ZZZZ
MCLSVVYKGKQKKEFLAKLPDVVTAWGVVSKGGREYVSICNNFRFVAGINEAEQVEVEIETDSIKYTSGFHRLLSRKEAEECFGKLYSSEEIHSCEILKEDIIACGEQASFVTATKQGSHPVIVAKRAKFPKYFGKGD